MHGGLVKMRNTGPAVILRSRLCDVMSLPASILGLKLVVSGPTLALRCIQFNLPSVFGFNSF